MTSSERQLVAIDLRIELTIVVIVTLTIIVIAIIVMSPPEVRTSEPIASPIAGPVTTRV